MNNLRYSSLIATNVNLMFIVRVKLRPLFEANKSHGNSSASLTTLAQIYFTPLAIISFNVLNVFVKLTLFV